MFHVLFSFINLNIKQMVSKKALSFDEEKERIKKQKKKKEVIKVPKHFYNGLSNMVKS